MAAPPALSVAIRPPGRIGRFSIRSAQAKRIGHFLKKHLWDMIQSVLPAPAGEKQGDNNLDTKAADTAGLYVFNLSVGTSVPQNITGILDITSELLWTQCPCSATDTDTCLPHLATTFQTHSSDTFSWVPCTSQTCQSAINQQCGADDTAASCTYAVTYNDYINTNTTGYLANDTFTFGETQVPGVVFGSQRHPGRDVRHPGRRYWRDDPESTTFPVTYLEEAAYDVVKQAFLSRIKAEAVNGSALGLDLCYTLQPTDEMTVPKLALVFDGRDATMELKKHNYFLTDNATNLECLTILPSPSKGGSLLGSLLQADTNITYDIDGGRFIFETASSAPRPHLKVSLMVAVQLVGWALLFF
ncbi:unnamed protein product [Urochloa decumbens]|uniref:Peptidase A1 domain-containing protein n=1 Tax=Urochloa decumbens TaxID=240449 RepID=A0ABC9DQR6_9POAL